MEPLLPGEDERLDRMLDPRVLDPAGEVVDYAGMSDEKLMLLIAMNEVGPGGLEYPDPDPICVRSHREATAEFVRRHGPAPRGPA